MVDSEISTRLVVHSYDEGSDTFLVEVEDLNYCYEPFKLPGLLLPDLTGVGGEPSELVGNTYGLAGPQFDTDLVSSHGCTFVGSAFESDGSEFEMYYDPSTQYVFKVRSHDSIDTLIYKEPLRG